ncbi:MAG: RNA-binding protein [Chlamydiales bacterium]|nr:RNA-binding protein [Chlamydiales bacterium]
MNQQNQKLYVGNLNFDANEEQVRELFSSFGDVEEVKIVMDRYSGRSRGFAFVRMDSAESAGKAKEALNGQPFQGKTLVIDIARAEQRDRPAGGGGERRSFGGGEGRERHGGGGEGRPRREWSDRGGERRGGGGHDRGDRSGGFYNR